MFDKLTKLYWLSQLISKPKILMTTLIIVLILGWLLASTIGTCAYFANTPMSEESARS